MSRTKKGSKAPGTDYWGKRIGNTAGPLGPSNNTGSTWQKKVTMHRERRADDAKLRRELAASTNTGEAK